MFTDEQIRDAFHRSATREVGDLVVGPGLLGDLHERHRHHSRVVMTAAPVAVALVAAGAIVGARATNDSGHAQAPERVAPTHSAGFQYFAFGFDHESLIWPPGWADNGIRVPNTGKGGGSTENAKAHTYLAITVFPPRSDPRGEVNGLLFDGTGSSTTRTVQGQPAQVASIDRSTLIKIATMNRRLDASALFAGGPPKVSWLRTLRGPFLVAQFTFPAQHLVCYISSAGISESDFNAMLDSIAQRPDTEVYPPDVPSPSPAPTMTASPSAAKNVRQPIRR